MSYCTKMVIGIAGLALAVIVGASKASAGPMIYTFDTFDDLATIGSQIAGLTFDRATALKAGFSLNDTAFPPRSGANVVFDDGGAITIVFTAPVSSAGAYFTYLAPLTLRAYDDNDNFLGAQAGGFFSNAGDGSGDPGSSVNQFLAVGNSAGLISRLVIESSQSGSSFTMDDLTVNTVANNISAPATLPLMLCMLGLGCLPGGWLRRPTRRRGTGRLRLAQAVPT